MGIQFRELWSWARHRKVLATLLVALTFGVGILIGTLISGRVLATRGQAAQRSLFAGGPRSRHALRRLFRDFQESWDPRSSTSPPRR